MEYAFVASWCQGKKHYAADALSRAPVSAASEDDELAEDRAPAAQSIRQVLTGTLDAEQQNLRLEAVQQATDADPEMQALQDTIQGGFPMSKADLPSMLHPYWNARDALTVKNGLILHGCRLVILSSMRRRVLHCRSFTAVTKALREQKLGRVRRSIGHRSTTTSRTLCEVAQTVSASYPPCPENR